MLHLSALNAEPQAAVSYLPYLLAGIICVGEIPTIRRRRPGAVNRDQGSYRLVTLLVAPGYWLAFAWWAIRLEGRRLFPPWVDLIGVFLTIGGTAFRLWAVRTLGRYFTRTVQVSSDQAVVQTGPYRFIRHPSYTGALIAGMGVGLALGNGVSTALIVIPMIMSFLYRIKVEEEALLQAVGRPYRDYMGRTKRLIPFVI